MIQRTSTWHRVVLCCCLVAIAAFIVAPVIPTGVAHAKQGKGNVKGGLPAALAVIEELTAEISALEADLEARQESGNPV